MQTVTTRRGAPRKKPFAWSYTKLKNYEACPKRHYHVDILKEYKDESEALTWGNKVHAMMAAHMTGRKPLPECEKLFREWADEVMTATVRGEKFNVKDRADLVLVEGQLAITSAFQPCEWFAPEAWYRAKVDLAWLWGPVAAAIDWKTGRVETESPQLALTAACLFIHYPQLQAVRSRYIFLKEDACTDLDIRRAELPELWNNLHDRIEIMKAAHETDSYPPTPCRLCEKWCPVKTCKYNGTRQG